MQQIRSFLTKLEEQRLDTQSRIEAKQKKLKKTTDTNDHRQLLATLTKKELDETRQHLQLVNTSKLNKHPLIEAIVAAVPHSCHQFIETMDNDRLKTLQALLKKDQKIDETTFTTDKLYFLRKTGLIFPVTTNHETRLVMPEEIRTTFNQMDQSNWQMKADLHDAVIRLAQGMLYYYGIMTKNTILALVAPIVNDDQAHAAEIINDAMAYYDYIKENDDYWLDSRVVDQQKLLKVQELSVYDQFFSFTNDQLVEAGAEDYMSLTDALLDLIRDLKQTYQLDDPTLNLYMDQVLILLNSFTDIEPAYYYLNQKLSLDSEAAQKQLLIKLQESQNSLHIWSLKGHKRNQPKETAATQQVKIGRNDPCLCGSGKKHKKCCGKI